MVGIILNGKLDSDAAEAALQFRINSFKVFGRDVRRVRVELGKYQRHGFFHQIIDFYRIYILVVDDMQQSIQFVRRCVDDA